MPGFPALGGLKAKAQGVFGGGGGGNARYEEFEFEKHVQGSDGPADDASTPDSIPGHERPPLRHIDKYIRPECPCLSKRVTVALLTCIGFIIMFGMRANMGLVKLKHKQGEDSSSFGNWPEKSRNAVESSIFFGYMITQVPGGFLAAKYPANKLFGMAIGCSAFLNLLVPGALSLEHPAVIIIIRVLQGLSEGVTYPACHGIWRYWAPPMERSKLATLAFCGCYAGVMLGMPISGELMKRSCWQAPFYFYGIMGITWYMTWLWLVFEKPNKHPTISGRELLLIENSIGDTVNTTLPTIFSTPWKEIFTSFPVYAIFVANFCRSWNFYFLVLFQVLYISQVFETDIEENALTACIPHLLMTIIVPSGGVLADYLRKNNILTTTQVRKLFNCGGFGMEAVFFLVVAYSNSFKQSIIALTFGVAFSGFAISGFNVNHLDIAPRYASILMGMSNGIGTLAGVFCPYVINGLITQEGLPEKEKWKEVFILAASVHFVGVTFYAMFASGELQPWAVVASEQDKVDHHMEYAVHKRIKSIDKDSPTDNANGYIQQPSTNLNQTTMPNYGSTTVQQPPSPPPNLNQQQQPVPNYGNPVQPSTNPFVHTNPFVQRPVQPPAQDLYLHGTVDDRSF